MSPFGESGRLIAAALDGGEAELRELVGRPELRGVVVAGRVAAALAVRAEEVGVAGPEVEAWRERLMFTTSVSLMLRHGLEAIAVGLGGVGITWAPFKGLGLSPHVYPRWEERPTSDIDVLVAEGDFERARAVLRSAGWSDSETTEEAEEFVAGEGCNWKAANAYGAALELHFRLWGCVPEGLAAELLARSQPDPGMGVTARRLRLADAWLVAAVHWWTTPPVGRSLLFLWDLRRIALAAGGGALAGEAAAATRRWGLELFVAPVGEAVAGLWNDATARVVAATARGGLRPVERLALTRIRRAGVERAGLELVSLARLLAGRESRMGWKAAWRRVWPHPAVLRAKTPAEWSWARRRAWFAAKRLGL